MLDTIIKSWYIVFKMIALEQFILAGNATFTVTSKRTGTHFTFKVRKPSETAPHFVSLLNGPDNENSYCFMGVIFNGQDFRMGRKSRITANASSAKAFAYIWAHRADPTLTDRVEIQHAGKCCCCGRLLTEPESITLGIGPICREKKGW
jgi:hypothetical protein